MLPYFCFVIKWIICQLHVMIVPTRWVAYQPIYTSLFPIEWAFSYPNVSYVYKKRTFNEKISSYCIQSTTTNITHITDHKMNDTAPEPPTPCVVHAICTYVQCKRGIAEEGLGKCYVWQHKNSGRIALSQMFFPSFFFTMCGILNNASWWVLLNFEGHSTDLEPF